MRRSNYDKSPFIAVPESDDACATGWPEIVERLTRAVNGRCPRRTIIAIDCYVGVDEAAIANAMRPLSAQIFSSRDGLRSAGEIERLVEPYLGGDDPVFGSLCPLELDAFFQSERLDRLREEVVRSDRDVAIIVGVGATLITPDADIVVYADLARWEAQLRFRRNVADNLGVSNRTASASQQYKRAFFVDWRVCDRWKKSLLRRSDFLLDTNDAESPKLLTGDAFRRALRHCVTRPFRVVPFFDPGP